MSYFLALVWGWLASIPVPHAEVPGLLSGMGVINTVGVFAYSTALNRVSGFKYRRWAAIGFAVAWIATACVVCGYVLNTVWGANAGFFVVWGLVLWAAAFSAILYLIYLASRDVVGRGHEGFERDPGYLNRFDGADFGVPAIDQVLRRALPMRGRVTYPFLLIHDIQSPGLKVVKNFVWAGLSAREAVIYLTFSRPHSVIRAQNRPPAGHEDRAAGFWVIDCYSPIYMPEQQAGRHPQTLFADARNPTDVYRQYMTALSACRAQHPSVRSVHETLSDYIKIADTDLVLHYLRRVVVLEEIRYVRSLYVFWQDAIAGNVDQKYLRWFFSTTLELIQADTVAPANTVLKMNNFYPDPVAVTVDRDLRFDEGNLFAPRRGRIARGAEVVARLQYTPRPYGFLREQQGPDRAFHLVNFLLFMVAIDHDTHRPNRRYEAVVNGTLRHGSDLLYIMAQQAKRADPSLFLPARFATLDEATVTRIFTAPDGSTPADLSGRTALMRDCAIALNRLYAGDACVLLQQAQDQVGGRGGLLGRLAEFSAYKDPIRKKASLLAKVLIREGVFIPHDIENLPVAIDHVVMTMALRSGMVACSLEPVRQAIAAGTALDQYQMDVLREVTGQAMQDLVGASATSSDKIDDLFWSYGRESLRRPTPLDTVDLVRSDIDGQVRAEALPYFIAFLNGVDGQGGDRWPEARTVRGPFTRFF